MSTIAQKLTYLNDTKDLLKDRINSLGGNITSQTTFRNYATELDNIYDELPKVSGTGTSINLTPTLKGRITSQMNGDTLQDGTPTPDAPINIQTVTGRQLIEVCGKNLFNKDTITSGKLVSRDNGNLENSSDYGASDYIPMEENTTYTLDSNAFNRWYSACYDKNKNYIGYVSNSNTFTTIANTKYMRFTVYLNKVDEAMIVKGNTLPTTYEPYQSQTKELNLGKNLFDKSKITSITNGSISGDVITSNAISSNYGGASANISELTLEAGTYYISTKVKRNSGTSGSKLTRITLVGIDASQITMVDNPNITNEYQIYSCKISPTSQIVLTNIGIQLQPTNVDAVMSFTDIMISKDSNTSYSPYFTPIELNKIGDYQDSIKRSTGKNLFDGIFETGGYDTTNGQKSVSNDRIRCVDYIEVKSNTTYTFSFENDGSAYFLEYDSNKTYLNKYTLIMYHTKSGTITTSSNTKYITFYYIPYNHTLTTNELCQIEQNSQATDFEPFLPKGTWYIEKKVGSVVLDGTENWGVDGTLTNTIRFRIATSYFPNTIGQSYTQHTISDYFVFSVNYNNDTPHYYIGGINANSYFFMPKTLVSNVTDFKTWLSTHNTLVYYVLKSPTYTTITNKEQLGLDEIENMSSYKGETNIVIMSENLPTIMNASAIKGEE